MNAGDGNDTITSSGSNASINAGNDTDTITITAGSATVDAGSGDDTITGDSGNQTITGGSGADTFNIISGSDTITDLSGIGANADALVVSAGASVTATLSGNFTANNLTLNSGGNVTINVDGLSNLNLANASIDSSSTGYTIDVRNGTFNYSNNIIGSAGDDTIHAGLGGDIIEGGAGNDVINQGGDWTQSNGGDGNDIINISAGYAAGGSGNDTFNIQGGTRQYISDLSGSDVLNIISSGYGVKAFVTDNYTATSATQNLTTNGGDTFSYLFAAGGSGQVIDLSGANTNTLGFEVLNYTSNGDWPISARSQTVNIIGTTANDKLYGGTGADRLDGGFGNDILDGNGGADTLIGGDGNDTITSSGSNASINAGNDTDTITITAGSATVDAGSGTNTITITGGSVTDTGTGTDSITISGTATFTGSAAGNDAINITGSSVSASDAGGDNFVTVDGSSASVTLGNGADTITITSAGGSASVNAGDGNDTITSSGAGSSIAGGTGNDTITINGASARVTDTGGDNFVTVAGSSATVTLGNGADTITITSTGLSANVDAGAGNNTVIGSINSDTITAGSGNDYISAGDGNNHITWTGGNDTIIGGSGIDTVQAIDSAVITKYYDRALEVDSHFSFSGGTVLISQLQAGNGTSVLSGIEKVLIGSTAQNSQTVLIVGAGGYASLTAASADATDGAIIYVADTTLIENGSSINTGLNNISIVLSSGTNPITMSLAEGQVGSVSIFGNHNFTINGTSDVDQIFDFTSITDGTNIINGNAGSDILVVRNAAAASTIINGGAGADTLIGGLNDQLYGGDGNDTLLAYNGAAYLAGQAGNDVLFNAYQAVAVAGNSGSAVVMLGGSGTDTFALIGNNTASGSAVTMNTTIADLSSGDKIDLSFLESGNNTLVIGGLAGKVSLTSAGTVVSLSGFDVSSSETGVIAGVLSTTNDTNSALSAESKLTVSGAKASATATALTSGFGAGSVNQDFNALFGSLTDTYIQST